MARIELSKAVGRMAGTENRRPNYQPVRCLLGESASRIETDHLHVTLMDSI